MQNLAEFSVLKDYAVKNCNADKNRIAVSGHSMGGFTTAGIFTHNPSVKTAVVFNGACDWQNAILQIEKEYDEAHIEFNEATKNRSCSKHRQAPKPASISLTRNKGLPRFL